MKPHIRTPYNAHERETFDTFTGELLNTSAAWDTFYHTPEGPKQTVPDQSLSIKEILDRYARGLPLGGQRIPVYEPDNDLPDPRTLDLAERQELAERYTAELLELRERENELKQRKVDAEKAAAEAAEEERYKKIQERLKKDAEGKPA